MSYLVTLALVAFVTELAIRLPFKRHITALHILATKIIHVIKSLHISDHWKSKSLLYYAFYIARTSSVLSLLLLVVLAVFAVLVQIITTFILRDFQSYIYSAVGSGLSVVVALLYISVRRYLVRG